MYLYRSEPICQMDGTRDISIIGNIANQNRGGIYAMGSIIKATAFQNKIIQQKKVVESSWK